MAGALTASGAMAYGGLRGARLNRFVSDVYSRSSGAIPSGYGQSAWLMSIKAGGIAGFSDLSISPSGSGLMGMPGEGSSSITFTVADADGQLISSGSGSASLAIALNNALLTASLNGSGEASLTVTVNAPTLGAEANLTASSSFQITGTLQPYAVGQMVGSTVDNTVLTSDSIANAVWEALSAAHTDSSTMGGKLNTASSGGVDLNALAQAVWEYATRKVDVEKMNGYTVTGTGQEGDPWRATGVSV